MSARLSIVDKARAVACPICKAKPGEDCVQKPGRATVTTHVVRADLAGVFGGSAQRSAMRRFPTATRPRT